jgi:hypothetical protein
MLAPLQLGRRLLPDPLTPLRVAQHLARAGWRAAQLGPALTRPVAERRWNANDGTQPRQTEAAEVSV